MTVRKIIYPILGLLLLYRIVEFWPLNARETTDLSLNIAFLDQIKSVSHLSFEYLFPEPYNNLIEGIIFGSKSELAKELTQSLKRTSTIHIVVASGQNLAILIGFLSSLNFLIGRKKTIFFSFMTIILYSIITGLQIPIIRAAIMMFFTLLAQLFGRESTGWKVLLFTGYLMVLFNPNWILSISFQLSFLATTGVMILAPELIKQVKFLPSIIKEDLLVTLSAQLLILPIIAVNFHTLSLTGILVNTLVLWTIPLVMIFGILCLASFVIIPFLGQVISIIPYVLLTYFQIIVSVLDVSWGSIYIQKYSLILWIGYYLLLVGLFLVIKKRNDSQQEKGDLISSKAAPMVSYWKYN